MPQAEVCIVTANLGGMDDLFNHVSQDIPVDYAYFTDDPTLKAPGWGVFHHQPNGVHPCLAAKRFKFCPPVPHRYVIWIDANIRIKSRRFARQALAHIQDGLAVHRHPFRNCIYQEALETIFTPKYDELPVQEQIRHYRLDELHPPDEGLYACGVIAWDREHFQAEALGRAWLAECERWGFQDQLSAPVVMRRLGVSPGLFPYDQYESPWFHIHRHR